ncbi:metallopeptidase TldD-related protein [Thioalkalivibrio thiocyanodenitrificans]|uniref:metallopeptidase TldD-related protein n=1 Tax=Thioalkalivibrio thiocyanodenitrificans TaxID=243063 RepID=UPI00037D7F4D|nr:metallopeptidase TldD-related protein [Thioalkalivibrio thiocyanodenitrificans]
MTDPETAFRELAPQVFDRLEDDEVGLLNLEGEDTDFVRFNCGRLRQAGHVRQRRLRLDLIVGARHARASLELTGDPGMDLREVTTLLDRLRDHLSHLPEDPHLLYATQAVNTGHRGENRLPDSREAVEGLLDAATGLDLVGVWTGGRMVHGFANSLGQFNWHSDHSFNLDWSVHGGKDQAVKQGYAGFEYTPDHVARQLDYARDTLALLARRPRTLEPGRYRVFLAPAALQELMNVLAWGGFGLKSHRTAQTPLLRMVREGLSLDSRVDLAEDHAGGLTPRFTMSGFIKPDRVELITTGRYRECLANPRSAREYGARVNCSIEHPESLTMRGDTLHQDHVLESLGTGLYISNLWYCNYSDRNHCRITGMTRFACLWVEKGRPVAPVNVMRFDESLFHVLGDRLEAITEEREHLFDTATYARRSQASAHLPGLLVDGFTFTL